MSALVLEAGADEAVAVASRLGQLEELLDLLARAGGPHAEDARAAVEALHRARVALGEVASVLTQAIGVAA